MIDWEKYVLGLNTLENYKYCKIRTQQNLQLATEEKTTLQMSL